MPASKTTPDKTFGTLTYHQGPPAYWDIRAVPHVITRIKRIFPRAQWTRAGQVTLSDTPEVARDLEWVVSRWPLETDKVSAKRLRAQAKAHRVTEEAVRSILAGHTPPDGGLREPARPLRSYQQQAVDLARATGRLLLADDVGLGKSASGIGLLLDPAALPALIVTLTHLPHQWAGEIRTVAPWLRTHIATKGTSHDLTTRCDGQPPDVLILNYAKLAGWADHLAGNIRTVIFDEVQELRRDGSAKYTAATSIADQAVFRVGLSATPVYNYGGEIHNVIRVLDRDALGSRDEFIREWGAGSYGMAGNVGVRDPAALGMYLREQGLMLRRTRKDVHREMPEPIRVEQDVDTDEATLDRLAGDAKAIAALVLSTTADRQDKWRAAGDLDWKLRHATGVAKAPYVAEFVRLLLESEDKVVLFGWHRDVYDLWEQRLAEFNPVFYTGEESPTQKLRNAAEFLDGDSRVLVMSLRAGAGLDGLQDVASVAVFGELDWSPGIHEQCLDEQTEILTRRGFVGPDDIRSTDVVAAFDRDTGRIRWEPVINITDRPLASSETMYEMKSPGVDLRVTGGHRMVYQHTWGSGHHKLSGWKVSTAAELAACSQGYRVPVAAIEDDSPGLPLTDAEIEFLGWFMTDGNFSRAARQVSISQALSSPYHDEIRRCLDECGFAWGRNEYTRDTQFARNHTMVTYYVPKIRSHTRPGRGWRDLEPYLDKQLSPLLDDMNSRQLGILLRAMHMGDGSKQRNQSWTQRSYHIGSGSWELVNRLQSLCVRRGWRANVATQLRPGRQPYFVLRTKENPIRHVAGTGKPNLRPCGHTPGERVWCVENALGTVVVRRNGKTAVVGNCIGRLHRDGQEATVVAYFMVSDSGSDPLMADVLDIKRQQSEPLRDPDAKIFEPVADNADRVKRLARTVLGLSDK